MGNPLYLAPFAKLSDSTSNTSHPSFLDSLISFSLIIKLYKSNINQEPSYLRWRTKYLQHFKKITRRLFYLLFILIIKSDPFPLILLLRKLISIDSIIPWILGPPLRSRQYTSHLLRKFSLCDHSWLIFFLYVTHPSKKSKNYTNNNSNKILPSIIIN